MAGSLSDFRASFKGDMARPSKFDVFIPVPIVLLPYLNIARTLQYRAENAELPSRTFSTADQKIGSNPVEKYPYQTSYNETTMIFMLSDDMSEKLFFDAWQEYINPTYSFDFRYKDDYISTIQVNQYDMTNTLTYSINLIDAWPISVNQLDLDWSADGYHKLSVVFAYRYWVNNSIQALGMTLLESGISQIASGVNAAFSGPTGLPGAPSQIANQTAPASTGATTIFEI